MSQIVVALQIEILQYDTVCNTLLQIRNKRLNENKKLIYGGYTTIPNLRLVCVSAVCIHVSCVIEDTDQVGINPY